MDAPPYWLVTATPLVLPVLSALGAVLSVARARRRDPGVDAVAIWIRWWFYGAMAVGGVAVFLSYLLVPDYMAGTLAFPASVPFAHEVGVANLGFAVGSVLSVRRSTDARVVIAWAYGVFLWGATVGHLWESLVHGNLAAGNTGGILAYDIALPVVALVLAHRGRTDDLGGSVRSSVGGVL